MRGQIQGSSRAAVTTRLPLGRLDRNSAAAGRPLSGKPTTRGGRAPSRTTPLGALTLEGGGLAGVPLVPDASVPDTNGVTPPPPPHADHPLQPPVQGTPLATAEVTGPSSGGNSSPTAVETAAEPETPVLAPLRAPPPPIITAVAAGVQEAPALAKAVPNEQATSQMTPRRQIPRPGTGGRARESGVSEDISLLRDVNLPPTRRDATRFVRGGAQSTDATRRPTRRCSGGRTGATPPLGVGTAASVAPRRAPDRTPQNPTALTSKAKSQMTGLKKTVDKMAYSPQPPPTRPLREKKREWGRPKHTTPAAIPVNRDAMRAEKAFEAASRIRESLLNANRLKDKGKPRTRSKVAAPRGAVVRLYKMDREMQEREAIAQFERAALLGLGKAANELAQIYLFGVGIPPDPIAARRWFHKALSLGCDKALCEAAQLLLSQGAVDAAAKVLSHPSLENFPEAFRLRADPALCGSSPHGICTSTAVFRTDLTEALLRSPHSTGTDTDVDDGTSTSAEAQVGSPSTTDLEQDALDAADALHEEGLYHEGDSLVRDLVIATYLAAADRHLHTQAQKAASESASVNGCLSDAYTAQEASVWLRKAYELAAWPHTRHHSLLVTAGSRIQLQDLWTSATGEGGRSESVPLIRLDAVIARWFPLIPRATREIAYASAIPDTTGWAEPDSWACTSRNQGAGSTDFQFASDGLCTFDAESGVLECRTVQRPWETLWIARLQPQPSNAWHGTWSATSSTSVPNPPVLRVTITTSPTKVAEPTIVMQFYAKDGSHMGWARFTHTPRPPIPEAACAGVDSTEAESDALSGVESAVKTIEQDNVLQEAGNDDGTRAIKRGKKLANFAGSAEVVRKADLPVILRHLHCVDQVIRACDAAVAPSPRDGPVSTTPPPQRPEGVWYVHDLGDVYNVDSLAGWKGLRRLTRALAPRYASNWGHIESKSTLSFWAEHLEPYTHNRVRLSSFCSLLLETTDPCTMLGHEFSQWVAEDMWPTKLEPPTIATPRSHFKAEPVDSPVVGSILRRMADLFDIAPVGACTHVQRSICQEDCFTLWARAADLGDTTARIRIYERLTGRSHESAPSTIPHRWPKPWTEFAMSPAGVSVPQSEGAAKWRAATAERQLAVALVSGDLLACYWQGMLLKQSNDPQQALEFFERAASGGHAGGHVEAADLCEAAGEVLKAKEHLEAAVEIEGCPVRALVSVGTMLHREGRRAGHDSDSAVVARGERLLLSAAEKGDVEAKYILGRALLPDDLTTVANIELWGVIGRGWLESVVSGDSETLLPSQKGAVATLWVMYSRSLKRNASPGLSLRIFSDEMTPAFASLVTDLVLCSYRSGKPRPNWHSDGVSLVSATLLGLCKSGDVAMLSRAVGAEDCVTWFAKICAKLAENTLEAELTQWNLLPVITRCCVCLWTAFCAAQRTRVLDAVELFVVGCNDKETWEGVFEVIDAMKLETREMERCSICTYPFFSDPVTAVMRYQSEAYSHPGCTHRFCKGCLEHWVTAKLDEYTAHVPCPETSCPCVLSVRDVSRICSDDVLKRFRELKSQNHVERLKDLARDKVALQQTAKISRCCPHCRVLVYRAFGCSSMTCVCGNGFDWDSDVANVWTAIKQLKL